MTSDEFEKELFDVINKAVESKDLPMAQILGLTYAAHETVKAAFDYQVYGLVKSKPKQD